MSGLNYWIDDSKTTYSIERVIFNNGDIEYEVIKHETGVSYFGGTTMRYSGRVSLAALKSETEANHFLDRIIRDKEKREHAEWLTKVASKTTLRRYP